MKIKRKKNDIIVSLSHLDIIGKSEMDMIYQISMCINTYPIDSSGKYIFRIGNDEDIFYAARVDFIRVYDDAAAIIEYCLKTHNVPFQMCLYLTMVKEVDKEHNRDVLMELLYNFLHFDKIYLSIPFDVEFPKVTKYMGTYSAINKLYILFNVSLVKYNDMIQNFSVEEIDRIIAFLDIMQPEDFAFTTLSKSSIQTLDKFKQAVLLKRIL